MLYIPLTPPRHAHTYMYIASYILVNFIVALINYSRLATTHYVAMHSHS